MAGAKKTVWDLALEITGQDKGAKAALASIKTNIKDVQNAGKQLSKDFSAFTTNASKLALGVVAGVAAAGAGVITMANSFASAGDQIAKTADSLGMAIEGYQKLKYAMTDSGLEAAEFDSAIQKMTNTINQGAAGNEAAQKQLENIGLSASKLASMRPEEAFERIADYMQTLPDDASRANAAIVLFGKTAGPRMAAAMKKGSAGIQALGAEAESLGIIFSESQARAAEEYGNQMNRLKSSVTGMKNQFIGGAIGPLTQAFATLRGAIQEQMPVIQELGAKFGQWLGDMIARLPEVIAKIKEVATNVWDNITKVKDFVGGWKNLAVIIGVLLSLKTILSGVKVVISAVTYAQTAYNAAVNISKSAIVAYKAAQTAAAAAGKGLTVAQWALNAAMAANPIGLIIAAVAALIAIIVLVVKNWDTIKEAMGKVWEKAKEVFGKIKDFILEIFTKIKEFIAGVFEGIKNIVSGVGEFFGGVFNKIKDGATKAWSGIKDTAGKAWDGIKGAASKAGGFLKDNWKSVAIGMVNPVAGGLTALYKNHEGFRNLVDGVWGKITDVGAKALAKIEDKFPGLVGVGRDVFGAIKQAAKGDFSGIKDLGNRAIEGLKNGFANFKDSACEKLSAVGDFFGNVGEGIKNIAGNVGNFFKVVWENAVGFVKVIIDGFKSFFSSVFYTIKTVIGLFSDFFKNVFTDPVGAVKNLFFGIVDVIKGIFDSIKEKVQSFVNFFTEKFKFIGDIIGGVKDFLGGVGNAVSGAVSGVKNFVGGLFGHADGGIFTTRHIAEICEKGPEAVVPLNNSKNGFDIWKEAGMIGGYMKKAAADSQSTGKSETPPVMKAAASQVSNNNGITLNVDFNMTNNFSGSPEKAVTQIEAAGQIAADDFVSRVRDALDSIMRDQRRASFA
ncbi:MAG: hypothetical protein FWB95_02545 [Treponema sp.]|nr:hypothetical protein [Treponema sp.]